MDCRHIAATAQRAGGPEVDIYRAGETLILNVATGDAVTDATAWRPRTLKQLPIG